MRWARRALPSSYRGRIALVIVVALVVGVGLQAGLRGLVNDRIRSDAQRTLNAQAQALAEAVFAARDGAKGDRASDALRYLPETRIKVTWDGPIGVYFNLLSATTDLTAEAKEGDVAVRLERASPTAGAADWLIVGLFLLGSILTAGLVWLLASALARRLRDQAGDLAASASAVAAGDLTVRAEVTDDELGRVAGAFNAMTANLASADQRQRRFLADVAHELRTPITAIDGFASALVDGAAASPEARAEAVMFIRDEAARLRVLIEDLRELTSLDLVTAIHPQRFELGALVAETIGRFGVEADRAGVTLEAPTSIVPVTSDPRQVETVVANLVRNAITATPPGGRIDVRVGRLGLDAFIEVADTGVGIAPEHLDRIFDRLYRVDDARSRDKGGSGLGLAIVKQVVEELLDGSVQVVSTPGVGTTFTVYLPANVAAA